MTQPTPIAPPSLHDRRAYKLVVMVSLAERQAIEEAAGHEALSSFVRRAALEAVAKADEPTTGGQQ